MRKVHKFKGHRGFCSLYKNCTLNRNGRGKIIGKLEKSTCNILVDPKVVHILVKQKKIISFFLIKFFLENCPKDWTFYRTTSMCYKFYKEKSKWTDALSFCKKIYPKVIIPRKSLKLVVIQSYSANKQSCFYS